jgi:hypothetical protein
MPQTTMPASASVNQPEQTLLQAGDGSPQSLGDIEFDERVLLASVRESGISDEFPAFDDEDLLRLSSSSMILCALASSADSMTAFEAALDEVDLPVDADEQAFVFGYCEHVRSALLAAFEESHESNVLRLIMRGRLARAQAISGVQSMAGEPAQPVAAVIAALSDVTYRLSAYFHEAFSPMSAEQTRMVMDMQDRGSNALSALTKADRVARSVPVDAGAQAVLTNVLANASVAVGELEQELAQLTASTKLDA